MAAKDFSNVIFVAPDKRDFPNNIGASGFASEAKDPVKIALDQISDNNFNDKDYFSSLSAESTHIINKPSKRLVRHKKHHYRIRVKKSELNGDLIKAISSGSIRTRLQKAERIRSHKINEPKITPLDVDFLDEQMPKRRPHRLRRSSHRRQSIKDSINTIKSFKQLNDLDTRYENSIAEEFNRPKSQQELSPAQAYLLSNAGIQNDQIMNLADLHEDKEVRTIPEKHFSIFAQNSEEDDKEYPGLRTQHEFDEVQDAIELARDDHRSVEDVKAMNQVLDLIEKDPPSDHPYSLPIKPVNFRIRRRRVTQHRVPLRRRHKRRENIFNGLIDDPHEKHLLRAPHVARLKPIISEIYGQDDSETIDDNLVDVFSSLAKDQEVEQQKEELMNKFEEAHKKAVPYSTIRSSRGQTILNFHDDLGVIHKNHNRRNKKLDFTDDIREIIKNKTKADVAHAKSHVINNDPIQFPDSLHELVSRRHHAHRRHRLANKGAAPIDLFNTGNIEFVNTRRNRRRSRARRNRRRWSLVDDMPPAMRAYASKRSEELLNKYFEAKQRENSRNSIKRFSRASDFDEYQPPHQPFSYHNPTSASENAFKNYDESPRTSNDKTIVPDFLIRRSPADVLSNAIEHKESEFNRKSSRKHVGDVLNRSINKKSREFSGKKFGEVSSSDDIFKKKAMALGLLNI